MERLDPPESKLDLDKYLWMFSTFGYLYSFDCTLGSANPFVFCTWALYLVFGTVYLVCDVFGIWDNIFGIKLGHTRLIPRGGPVCPACSQPTSLPPLENHLNNGTQLTTPGNPGQLVSGTPPSGSQL